MLNQVIQYVSQLDEEQLDKLMKKLQKKFPTSSSSPTKEGTEQQQNTEIRCGAGFDAPVFIKDELVNFLREAFLVNQTSEENKEQTQEKKNLSQLLDMKIVSRSLLTPMFITYMYEHNNRFEENYEDKEGKNKSRIFFKVDDLMNKYFHEGLTLLEEKDAAKTESELIDMKGNVKLRFNRNRFLYSRLQSIVNLYIIPGLQQKPDSELKKRSSELLSTVTQYFSEKRSKLLPETQ